MTAITRPARLFSRRNRRRGARAGLVAMALQLLLILGQALPAAAADGQPLDDTFICVVYKSGTAPASHTTPTPDTKRSGHGGHNTCSICIVSSAGAGAVPALTNALTLPAFGDTKLTMAETPSTPTATAQNAHRVRAPPFVL